MEERARLGVRGGESKRETGTEVATRVKHVQQEGEDGGGDKAERQRRQR